MELTLTFIQWFGFMLLLLWPLLAFLLVMILSIGLLIGWLERWSLGESFYFVCITATTVGYGDFRPQRKGSRLLSVAVALIGLVTTGIIVSVGVSAVERAFDGQFDRTHIKNQIEETRTP